MQSHSKREENHFHAQMGNSNEDVKEVLLIQKYSDNAECSLNHDCLPKQATHAHQAPVNGANREPRNGECFIGDEKYSATQSKKAECSKQHDDGMPELYMGNKKNQRY